MKVRGLLLVVAACVLAACGGTPAPVVVTVQYVIEVTATPIPCYIQARQFVAQVEPYLDDWDDANQLAGSTSRIALSPVVGRLQEIRRDVEDIESPPCASGVRQLMLDYMNEVIDAYIAFMAQAPDSAVQKHFETASKTLEQWGTQFTALKAGLEPFD